MSQPIDQTHPSVRHFPGLSPAAFQHPRDVQATANLRKVPLLGGVIKTLSASVLERQMRLFNISSAVRLGPKQGSSLYRQFTQAAAILDLPALPEVYVSSQYTINAVAFGVEKYQITLYSGLIDMLTEAELLAVIGHELGHVKCQHMLYKTMAYILRYLGVEALNNLLPAGMGRLASLPLQLAILHWERMAEFSCDRAALLVVQDETVVANALAKLAGGSQKIMPELNLSQILQQAREYDEADEQFLEKLFKVNMMLLQTHPFPIVRAKEIVDWSATEQYRAIMRGDYAVDPPGAASQPGEPVVRVCSHCKQTVGRAAATCPACGQAVKKGHLACGQCGLKVFAGWSACPGCGSRLAEGSVN